MVTKRYPKPGCHIQTHFFFILLSWLTILTLVNAYAVRPKVDSLRIALFKSDDLRNKVKIYLEIAKAMEETTPDSSVVFLKEARSLAQGLKSEKPLADVYAQSAFLNLKQNQLDQAFFNFNMAAKYYGISGDQELSTRMKSMLGSICLVQDNIVEALTYFMEVIDLSEKHHLYTILPHVLSNVGNIYLDCDDYNTALDYYSNSLILFRQIGDTVNTAYPLLNLGEACYYLGNLDMSCEYIRQSIDVARKSKDNVLEARGLMILGMISSKQNKYPEAIDFFNKSYEIQKKNAVVHPGPANIQFSELMANFGDTWYRMGDLQRSLIYNRKGFSIARSMKQVRQIMITTQQLSMIFERESRFDSALFYHKIYTAQADSLAKSGNIRAVKLLEVKQEYDKQQKVNVLNVALANSAKRTLFIVYISSGGGLLAVILILFLMLRLERSKKKQANLEKLSLNEKLDFQNKELTTNVVYLSRMNELAMSMAGKLKRLDLREGAGNEQTIRSMIHELEQSSIIDAWKEFEIRFQNVHIDFYKKLGEKFPDLSPNELKLCAFLRLNMSTKEISTLTYQSQDSIRMARSRLRQKLGVSKDENLVSFLTLI